MDRVAFLASSRDIGEAGLLLAESGASPHRAGCLTLATALGAESALAFERARLRFEVRDSAVSEAA
jgi:hypothetical protein